MNLTQIADGISGNDPFKRKVEYELYAAAVNVMAEVNTTANHAARVTFATNVLVGQADIRSAVIATLTNATLASAANMDAISDGDLPFVISSVFNALAGIGT